MNLTFRITRFRILPTSLVRRVERWGAEEHREWCDTNPFMPLVYENRKVFVVGWFSVMAGGRRAGCTSAAPWDWHGNPFQSGLAMSCPKRLQSSFLSISHSAKAAETPLEEAPAWTSPSFVPSTERALLPHFCRIIQLFFFFPTQLWKYCSAKLNGWLLGSASA